jgi:hypothetical protein
LALAEQFCSPGIVFLFKQKIILGRWPMSSSWDPAIPQAMQRHGGSNRSVPKAKTSAPSLELRPDGAVLPEPPAQARRDFDPPVKQENP